MNTAAESVKRHAATVPLFPINVKRRVIVGAGAWALSIVFFVVQGIAQSASARPFSLTTNLISDLGNTACGPSICSPLHDLINLSFIVVGVMHVAGSATTWSAWPGRMRSKIGLILLGLAGWGLAYAGAFPENVAPDNHRVGAVIGLVSLNLSMLLLGSALLEAARATGVLAVLAGVIGVIALALFLSQAPTLPIGVSERLANYPGAVMVILFGVLILVRAINPLPREPKVGLSN